MPTFLLAGHEIDIDRETVEIKATNLKPEQALRRNYTIEVGGKIFPIKQLLATVVNLPPQAFITHDAYKIFTELGYYVQFKR